MGSVVKIDADLFGRNDVLLTQHDACRYAANDVFSFTENDAMCSACNFNRAVGAHHVPGTHHDALEAHRIMFRLRNTSFEKSILADAFLVVAGTGLEPATSGL